MLKILANDGMDKDAVKKLQDMGHSIETEYYEGDALVEKLKEVDVVVIRSKTKIRTDLIDRVLGGNLKLIIRAGVGIDNIDHVYAEEKGITVKNTPNSSSASVAELALAHMFTLSRHLHKSNVTMKKGEWNKKEYKGIELNGKTLGLVGFGRISKSLAAKASALGMKIVYSEKFGEDKSFPDYKFMSLEELLKVSDFVSFHIPFIKEEGPTMTKKQFDMMKDGSYLIQLSRGGVVNESALLEAINSGKIAGAALDVFESEPLNKKEIIECDKISLTPHIGASTAEAQKRIGDETIDVISKFFA